MIKPGLQRPGFFAVRPAGRTCSTVKQRTERNGVSLLTARQREGLAEGQLRGREALVGRKPRAKRWPDEQEPHTRRSQRARRPLSLKPEVCPEAAGVDAAGISVKAGVSYPGRSAGMPAGARAVETRREMPAEVSRGHSSRATRGEGPNRNQTMETAPLTLVARQKESLKAARLSGSNPVGNGMYLHECLKLGIGGKSLHRVANAPALRQASLVTKPPDA